MSCAHAYVPSEGGEGIFSVDTSRLTFGRGALRELGAAARELGCRRVAVFTDARVKTLEAFERALASLAAAGVDAAVFDEVQVEPTDASFAAASRFASCGLSSRRSSRRPASRGQASRL